MYQIDGKSNSKQNYFDWKTDQKFKFLVWYILM